MSDQFRIEGPEFKPGEVASFEGVPVEIVDVLTSTASGQESAMLRPVGVDVAPFPVARARLNRSMTVAPARTWQRVLDELDQEEPQTEIRYALRAEQHRLLDQGELSQVAVTYPHEYAAEVSRIIEEINSGD